MGNWQTIEYNADINNTILGVSTNGSSNRRYQLPNGSWSNYKINYWYTIQGNQNYVSLDCSRNVQNVPFTFGGTFKNYSSTFAFVPTVTQISSGVQIGTVNYRGVYGGGLRTGVFLPTSANSGNECSISTSYQEGSATYPLTSLNFKVDYRFSSFLTNLSSSLPYFGSGIIDADNNIVELSDDNTVDQNTTGHNTTSQNTVDQGTFDASFPVNCALDDSS